MFCFLLVQSMRFAMVREWSTARRRSGIHPSLHSISYGLQSETCVTSFFPYSWFFRSLSLLWIMSVFMWMLLTASSCEVLLCWRESPPLTFAFNRLLLTPPSSASDQNSFSQLIHISMDSSSHLFIHLLWWWEKCLAEEKGEKTFCAPNNRCMCVCLFLLTGQETTCSPPIVNISVIPNYFQPKFTLQTDDPNTVLTCNQCISLFFNTDSTFLMNLS